MLVSGSPRVKPWAENYVFVDWGEEFRSAHARAFPDMPPPALSVGLGALGLQYILEHKGAGYLPSRAVGPLLEEATIYCSRRARLPPLNLRSVPRQPGRCGPPSAGAQRSPQTCKREERGAGQGRIAQPICGSARLVTLCSAFETSRGSGQHLVRGSVLYSRCLLRNPTVRSHATSAVLAS